MSMQTPEPQGIDALLRRVAESAPAAPAARTSDPAHSALAARIAAQVVAAQARERSSARKPRSSQGSPLGTWAAAASLLLAVAIGSLGQPVTTLPDYSLEISGNDQGLRSAGAAAAALDALKVSPGNRLRITARPQLRVAEPLHAELWRSSPTGPAALELPIQVSTSGAIQFDAQVDSRLLPSPGAHRLWLVLSASSGKRLRPASLSSITTAGRYGPSYVLPIQLELQSQ